MMIAFLQTADGIRFGVIDNKSARPAPTVFVFAATIEGSLDNRDLSECAQILAGHGLLVVGLDLPAHGRERRVDESENGMTAWRARMEKGDTVVPAFLERVSRVLDHLVAEGAADPANVSACGTSRGGYTALRWAAAEPRVRRVAAFAPVTNLLALREFDGADYNPTVNSQSLIHQADHLAGRPIWMCIGNHDQRVDTREAILFAQRVTVAAIARNLPPDIELRIQPSSGHAVLAGSHAEAAAWLLKRIRDGGTQKK